MLKTLRAVRVYARLDKTMCYNHDSEKWERHMAGVINRTLLVACHEGQTKCGVKLRAKLHAPHIIWEIRKLM